MPPDLTTLLNSIDDTNIHEDSPIAPSKYYDIDSLSDLTNTHNRKNNISIFNTNCRSLPKNKSKYDILFETLSESNQFHFDILSFCETWLSNDLEQIANFNGYNKIMKHKSTIKGGGLAIFIRETLKYKIRNDITVPTEFVDLFDGLFIQIDSKPNDIVIGVLYRSPSHNTITAFNEFLLDACSTIRQENRKLILTGDFNINLLLSNASTEIGNFLDSLMSYNLIPKITVPTRITSNSATLIDHIYTNIDKDQCLAGTLTTDISDHFCNFIFIETNNLKKHCPASITYRQITDENLQKLNENLSQTDWNSVYTTNDPDMAYNKFIDTYLEKVDKCMPLKTCKFNKFKHKVEPWITKGLLKSLRTKNKLYTKYIKCLSPTEKLVKENNFKIYRNIYNKLIKKAKEIHWHNAFQQSKGDIKETWRNINSLLGRHIKKRTFPDQFKNDTELFNTTKDIANGFNEYFVSIGPKLASKIQNQTQTHHSQVHYDNPNSFFLSPTNPAEVVEVINKLKPKTSTDYNYISPKILKYNSNAIAEPLAHVINLSFKTGYFPQRLKIAKVIPIYKNKENNSFENYRPIALLPTFSKIIERLMYNRLYKYVKINNILNPAQYGFQNKRSTEHAILELKNRVINYLAKKHHCIGIFIDLSKAFDTLNHSILLEKLYSLGIRGIPHRWFSSYLKDRSQFVEYLSSRSEVRNVSCGVPQGSILGPLLFLLYVNDITSVCNECDPILFADDTTLIFHNTNYESLYRAANRELNYISNWFSANKLSLNVEKTQFIHFNWSHNNPSEPSNLMINDNYIHNVNYAKFLGVLVDKNMKWNEHISRKCSQISRTIGVLCRLKNTLPKTILLTLYKSLVLPDISYGVVAWGSTDNGYIKRMFQLQKRALRIITNSKYNSHTSPLFKSLNLLTLSDIYQLECSKIYAKFCRNELPTYLNDQLQDTNRTTHIYPTRNTTNILQPIARNKIEKQLIQYRIASTWNALPDNIKSFKNHPKSVKYFSKQFKRYKVYLYDPICHIPNCYICNRLSI